uniref:Uncharacterized protein n=1 Tax=Magallana gigas TaxID=29159 RepID=K1R3C3_MAGGI
MASPNDFLLQTVTGTETSAETHTGILEFHNCPCEPLLPLFLTLNGAALLLKCVLQGTRIMFKIAPPDGERHCLYTVTDMLTLFLFLAIAVVTVTFVLIVFTLFCYAVLWFIHDKMENSEKFKDYVIESELDRRKSPAGIMGR